MRGTGPATLASTSITLLGEPVIAKLSPFRGTLLVIITPMNLEQKLTELKRRDSLAEAGGGEERRAR